MIDRGRETGLLYVISGPSGVGKDTILGEFLPNAENCSLSISATTRPPRLGEKHGREYYFINREEFARRVAAGEMLEYTEYNGNYYGTPRKEVEEQLNRGKDVILELEVDGGLQVKRLDPKAVLVFVVAPSIPELERRLRARGTESEAAIQARMNIARFEISKAHEYDYVIINDDLSRCVSRLKDVISAAHWAAKNMRNFIEEVIGNA
jgi:guanylate kinase